MRKHVFGRQLKRDTNERKALFKGLLDALVIHEGIQTTEEKARAIKGQAEKLITQAKRKGILAKHLLQPFLSTEAIEKVIQQLAPRFAERPGGYTRLVKLGKRFSDNASVVLLEWVDKPVKADIIKPAKTISESVKEEKVVIKEDKKEVIKKSTKKKSVVEKKNK